MNEYGTLEQILAAAPAMKASKRRDNLIEHADAARMSRRLVLLDDNAPMPQPISELGCREPVRETLRDWLEEMGFHSTIQRMGLGLAAKPRPFMRQIVRPEDKAAARDEVAAVTIPDAPYGPYETVTDMDALDRWIADARAAGVMAVDTETDSLNARQANMVGLSLSVAPGRPVMCRSCTKPYVIFWKKIQRGSFRSSAGSYGGSGASEAAVAGRVRPEGVPEREI